VDSGVSLTDASGPGFYQDRQPVGRLAGRKTGRLSPREAAREPRWESVLKAHDLLPEHRSQVGGNGSYDPNQGQLFDPEVVQPRQESAPAGFGEIEYKAGNNKAVMGLAAAPGFMPNLNKKQKVAALNTVAAERGRTGADRGGSPIAEMLEDRRLPAGYENKRSDWYQGPSRTREDAGAAPKLISGAAARTGSSFSLMARAVAQTSLKLAWTIDNDDPKNREPVGANPNIRAAEAAVRYKDETTEDDPVYTPGARPRPHELPMPALGTAVERAKTTALAGDPVGRFSVSSPLSQKTANFDASLHLSHVNPAIARKAAEAWTVDRHDLTSAGFDEKSLDKRGVYDVLAMTGRRAALKAGELPPNYQADLWEAERLRKGHGRGYEMFHGGYGDEPVRTNPKVLDGRTAGVVESRAQQRYRDDLDLFGS
jgi:hypothetical protein